MAEITVKFDPSVDIEEIQMPLVTATPEEEPDSPEGGEYQQTKVEGIAAPMVRLNNLVIMSSQIIRMELSSRPLPKIDIEIADTFGLSRVLDSPKSDNLLVLQVIPPFDNGYKKINLRFYITDYRVLGSNIRVHGEYNIRNQHDVVLESFGEKTTYEFVELVANRLSLGLASNLSGTEDKRYIYCPSKDLLSVVGKEVQYGGSETSILDWWIDFWNYLNLVDVYDRYNSDDPIPKIWTKTTNGVELNEDNTTDPVEVDAVLTNHPSMRGTPLYIGEYNQISNTIRNLVNGTEKKIETFSMLDIISEETDVIDGDIEKDIFKKYEYRGEVFGAHNYLLQESLHNSFIQKMESQKIEVTLARPQFGLSRGGRLNLAWYECSDFVTQSIGEENSEIMTHSDEIDTADANSGDYDNVGNPADQTWTLNKIISGKYYILDSILRYDTTGGQMNWMHTLVLSRPASEVETYIEVLEADAETENSSGSARESTSGISSGLFGIFNN